MFEALIPLAYILSAALFIFGLKTMSILILLLMVGFYIITVQEVSMPDV